MRRPRTALGRKRVRWEGITGNLAAELDQFPHLKGHFDLLMGKIQESLALEGQIGILQGSLGEALERLDQVAAEGEELRGRLTAALQAEFGFDSSRLHYFGLKPRRPRGRRKKTAQPPATDTTDTAERADLPPENPE
jgi:hypothetical protein